MYHFSLPLRSASRTGSLRHYPPETSSTYLINSMVEVHVDNDMRSLDCKDPEKPSLASRYTSWDLRLHLILLPALLYIRIAIWDTYEFPNLSQIRETRKHHAMCLGGSSLE